MGPEIGEDPRLLDFQASGPGSLAGNTVDAQAHGHGVEIVKGLIAFLQELHLQGAYGSQRHRMKGKQHPFPFAIVQTEILIILVLQFEILYFPTIFIASAITILP